MDFNASVKVILNHEGGYVNDPDDPGGETNFGICKRSFPNLDIKNLTKAQAAEIYREKYWNPLKCELINNKLLRLHLFDMGVNAGLKAAVVILQDIIKVSADGNIGPITIAETNKYADQESLAQRYALARLDYYQQLTKNPKLKKFLKGWENRVTSTKL